MKPLTLEDELESMTTRSWWHRLLDGLFGYDFFISYRWEDGRVYAVRLARELKECGYDCFLDSESYSKGENWKAVGALAIRRTSRLVLVGSPGVLRSDPVLREVRIFSRSGRRIIPINFGTALSAATLSGHPLQDFLPAELLQIQEEAARLTEGPSESTVRELQKAFDCERQSARRLRALRGAVVALLIVAVVAVLAATFSLQAKRTADQTAAALRAELEKAQQLEMQRAELRRVEEERRKKQSEDEVASVQLARHALSVLEKDPELARLLGIEAVQLAATREAQQALRKTVLDPLPPLVLRGHSNSVSEARFSPDGKWIFTVGTDRTARLWDAVSGTVRRILEPNSADNAHDDLHAVLSRDGTKALVMSRPPTLALGYWESRSPIQLFDTASGKLLASISDKFASDSDWSPDQRQVVTASFSIQPRIWDATTGKVQFELPGHENAVSSASFSSDGQWVVTAGRDGTARVWEARNGRNVAVLRAGSQLEWAGFIPGGRIVTLDAGERFGDGKHLQLWDWKNSRGSSAARFVGHERAIRHVEHSADGARLATAAVNEARVWDTASGRNLAVLNHPDDQFVSGMGLSPNGEWVVTVSPEGAARIWEASTGDLLIRLGETQTGYSCTSFSPDGKRIVAGTAGGDVLIYDCAFCGSAGELLHFARTLVTRQLSTEERTEYLRSLPARP